MTTDRGYLLDNQQAEAGTRFEALSALFDPGTLRRLDALGVTTGWRCWEVGAGGATIPAWMAERVGDSGRVLATDIDTSWLPADTEAGFEVRRHEVGTDPLPAESFDLIHARLLLVHVPGREQVIRELVTALRPGGWVLLEEADPALQPLTCIDEHDDATRLANELRRGFRSLMAARDVDLAFGRKLPRLLREAGLADVQADAYFPVTSPACTVLERATVEQMRGRLIEAGLATADQIDEHLANLDGGALDVATSPLISAWGRRPE